MRLFDSDSDYYTPPTRTSYPTGGPGYTTGLQIQPYQGPVADQMRPLDTGLQIQERVADQVRYFSDPYIDQFGNVGGLGGGVSRTGPTASAQYYGAINPFIRAGSLLSGRLPGQGGYRGASYQRGFTVEMQDRLRRRKRNRFMT